MRIAIIGAGNGGQSMAGHLTLEGHDVTLYDIDTVKINAIKNQGGIYLTNFLEGFAEVKVSTDIKDTIRDANIIMITTTAPAHRAVAEEISSIIEDGQVILIMPGYWGSMEFRDCFNKNGVKKDVILGEAEILKYTCRTIEAGKVDLRSIKKEIQIAALPSSDNDRLLSAIEKIFPGTKPAQNVLVTTLNNINPIFHPPITIFNAGRIEADGDFFFYPDGVTPRIAEYIQNLDNERLKIGEALGIKLSTAQELLKRFYGVDEDNIYDGIQSNQGYKTGKAPKTLEYRYIYEDYPYGLVPLSNLGKALGVETIYIDRLIDVTSCLMGKDLRSMGLDLKKLGLEDMRADEIKKYFT